MFPLKDNIPTDRFPFVTVALIVANVIVYFLFQDGGLGLPNGGQAGDWPVDTYAYIPCEITGETHEEMVDAFGQLRSKGVQVLTVGQYLRPTERHLPVVRYWHPDEFKALETAAYELGFEHIAAGPLVRSSYHADEHVMQDRPGVGPVAATG